MLWAGIKLTSAQLHHLLRDLISGRFTDWATSAVAAKGNFNQLFPDLHGGDVFPMWSVEEGDRLPSQIFFNVALNNNDDGDDDNDKKGGKHQEEKIMKKMESW